MKCEDIQKELEAFIDNDIDDPRRVEIQTHLDKCQNCSHALRQLVELSEVLQTWREIEPSPAMYEKLKTRMDAYESFWTRIFTGSFAGKVALRFMEVVAIVALTLLVNHLIQKPEPEASDNQATINFYLTEHQEAVMRTVSLEPPARPSARMYVERDDIMYYEFIDDFPEFARPGIILRGPASQPEVTTSETPTIANGRTLTLAEARNSVYFDLSAPPRFHPGYILDSIRKIDDHNALHLLYTNGVDTVSLFQQSLGGERTLGAQDFREYAVYRSEGRVGKTILAWNNDSVSFILIGKADMSQLMDMAQSISATNRRER
ncbi:anti-sigma factor family protein [Candidatus Poribacteria bacterium]